ncbi:MAG: substrate-binding domain-containing protein, partial [Victivallales bacterium]|nr:substrate-binding domain-containing protein [Victivallales bacterium]
LRVDGCITTENGLSIIEGLTCDKVVMYAREDRDYEYDNIVISSETAMEQAVDLIMTLNRSSIRFLCCEEFKAHSGNNLKLDIYRRLFKKHGIALPESSVIRFKRSFNDMHNAVTGIIKDLKEPTVLIALSDAIAFETLRTALDMGVSVPKELAVLGFDDAPFASTITPSLTTFAKNRYEMGGMAVKKLLKRIASRSELPPERTVVHAELVRRESL